MTSPRHFAHFLALGLFWGCSPSLYKHLADIGVPGSQTILLTGLGVGLLMWTVAIFRGGGLAIDRATLRYGAICAFLMNIPFGIDEVMEAQRAVVRENKLESGYLRPLTWIGSEKLAINARGNTIHLDRKSVV